MKVLDLLRKKDLHPEVEMPKSTVADWIEDFNIYIPKVKQGNVIYYKPETIDVLKFIKQCREQNYHKAQIMQMLAEKGFPITVDDGIEDVKNALEVDTPRDTLLNVLGMTGQAMVKLAEQDERFDKVDGRLEEQDGRINGLDESLQTLSNQQVGRDERVDELERRTENEVDYLKREIEELKKELVATKEKKGFFSRLFGK